MSFTLYTYFRSSASYRVRIALAIKGIGYQAVGRHLRRAEHRTPEFLQMNPQGLVPVLEHDGRHFSQSLAIIEYLEELQPEPPLLPESPEDRATVRAMAAVVACEIHPLCNLRVLQYLREELGQDEDTVKAWYRHWVAEGLAALEATVAKHETAERRYCFGDRVTLADVCLVPQMHNARRFDCDLAPYPRLRDIDERLRSLPAFVEAQPDRQPDAE